MLHAFQSMFIEYNYCNLSPAFACILTWGKFYTVLRVYRLLLLLKHGHWAWHDQEGICSLEKAKSSQHVMPYPNKKAVLLQGNRAMPQLFFKVRQQHLLQA